MSHTMFSVSAFVDNAYVFQSDIFGTRDEVNNLMNLLKSSNTGDIKFQLYKHFPRGSLKQGTQHTIDYTSMNLYNHDKLPFTYILESPSNNDEYLFDGIWDEDYLGWILTQEQARIALENGVHNDLEIDNIDFDLDEFKNMILYPYDETKNTYILVPTEECSIYGQKYFSFGKWRNKSFGWVFGQEYIESLISFGVTQYKEEDEAEETEAESDESDESDESEAEAESDAESDESDESEAEEEAESDESEETESEESEVDTEVYDFEGFTIEYYKNGLLMKCQSNHPLIGEKYLVNGYWNVRLGGWVFKKEELENLTLNGAKLIKQEEVMTDTLSTTFEKMTYTVYGKGHLLIPKKNHPDFGEKYYYNGYWMPKQNAWFFRGRYSEFVKNCGAKEI